MKIQKRIISLLLVIGMFLTLLTGCGGSGQTAENEADTFLGNGRSVLRIVSGSENAELEPILTKFAEQENVRIEMTYQGSLDIMRLSLCGRPAACGLRWGLRSIVLNMRSRFP